MDILGTFVRGGAEERIDLGRSEADPRGTEKMPDPHYLESAWTEAGPAGQLQVRSVASTLPRKPVSSAAGNEAALVAALCLPDSPPLVSRIFSSLRSRWYTVFSWQ